MEGGKFAAQDCYCHDWPSGPSVIGMLFVLPVSRWEYQVIHLNVEDSSQAAAPPSPGPVNTAQPPSPETPPGSPAPLPGQPVFSQAYLEQEFPDFYSNPPQQQPQPQQQANNHPALQLQNFLNVHGQQGWSLVGIYPLGSLLMMFFRRRIADPPVAPIQAASALVPQQVGGDAGVQDPLQAGGKGVDAAPATSAPADGIASPSAELLQQILQRLDSLEGRTPPSASSKDGSSSDLAPVGLAETLPQASQIPGERRLRRRSSASQVPGTGQPPRGQADQQTNSVASSPAPAADVAIVSSNILAALQSEVGIPTFHAAKALDFRSYATLAGFGSRHGYPLGLLKEGPNKMAAVYVGLEQGDRGGRAKRLWVVIPVDRLRALDNH